MFNTISGNILENQMYNITIDQLAPLWLSEIQFNVKPSTYATYFNLIRSQIIPFFKNYKIENFDSLLLYQFANEKLRKGRINNCGGLSAKTVKDMLMIIRLIFTFAQTNYGINIALKFPTIKNSTKNISTLTKQEQMRLENYVLSNLNCETIGILICLYTGIRIGELCALKWSDIDFHSNVLHISRTAQRITNTDRCSISKTKLLIDTPKSIHSIRSIPLPNFLCSLLKNLYTSNLKKCFLLSSKFNKILEPRNYQYKFKHYLKDCNLTPTNFHTLRHTFATRCVEEDFDIKSLSEILGHANINITLNRYVHSSMEFKTSQMQRLELLA